MIQILQRFHISVPILKKLLTSHSACAIILKQCGYGGIGRRVWFGLRYDSVKKTVLTMWERFCVLYYFMSEDIQQTNLLRALKALNTINIIVTAGIINNSILII